MGLAVAPLTATMIGASVKRAASAVDGDPVVVRAAHHFLAGAGRQ